MMATPHPAQRARDKEPSRIKDGATQIQQGCTLYQICVCLSLNSSTCTCVSVHACTHAHTCTHRNHNYSGIRAPEIRLRSPSLVSLSHLLSHVTDPPVLFKSWDQGQRVSCWPGTCSISKCQPQVHAKEKKKKQEEKDYQAQHSVTKCGDSRW